MTSPLLESTIGECLSFAAQTWPDVDALVSISEGIRLTFRELDADVDRLAAGLLSLGLRKGDRVAIWAPNCAAWTLLQFATARAGLVLVTFNTAYRRRELEHVLALSGARAIVSASGFKEIDYAAELEAVPNGDLEWRIMLGDTVPAGWIAFADVAANPPPAWPKVVAEEPVNIQFTSGTTGNPKGVTLTHRNILNNGAAVGKRAGISAGDRICLPVPLFHCFGMVMGNLACVAHGATMIYPSTAFDPDEALMAISTERATHCYGVPTMFIAMLNSAKFDDYDLTSLRGGIMAGTTCPVEVMKQVIDRMNMGEVTIAYGMTETSPVSVQTLATDPLEMRVETVGRVMPHIEIKIINEQGDVVPRGAEGELCTRGYSVMAGYWNDPAATRNAIDIDGYMHSGDIASMDAEGFVRITGRAKDMIIRGGENISPREVEEFLYGHPEIVDVAVIGAPHPKYGEEVCAWIVRTSDSKLEPADVVAFCRNQLAHYKIPTLVRVVDHLPMTPSGKVQKYLMRAAESQQEANA